MVPAMVASRAALRNEILDRLPHRIWVPAGAMIPCRIVVWASEPGWPPVHVKFAFRFAVILALGSWSGIGFAQKLVDPNAVAPEFRAAAEKRRAEQIKLLECTKKANQAKVLPRDRAGFIGPCLEK